MRLIIPILLNCFLVLAVYLAEKYTPTKKLPYYVKQVIIGILFGCVSAFASSYGVEWLGTVVNVRDAAPLSAGLIFGAPAGIISGLIGGLYRWFSVYWGGGTYTQLACALATILAGFLAAGLGSALADLLSGYVIYAPATFVIKGLMALAAFYGYKFLRQKVGLLLSGILGGLLAEIIMVLGYFVFEGFLYGFVPSMVNIPANGVQGVAGIIVGVVLMRVLEKTEVVTRR